jgi:hypothetical protein
MFLVFFLRKKNSFEKKTKKIDLKEKSQYILETQNEPND